MKFIYDTGIRRKLFKNVRVCGSWDGEGRHSDEWTTAPMREIRAADGAIVFAADVNLAKSEIGREFSWTVLHDGPLGLDREGIVTEQRGLGHDALHRSFTLSDGEPGEQRYYLTHVRRLGARKLRLSEDGEYGLRFAVWAPNAQAVEVVFGTAASGYIADDGTGIDPARPVIALTLGDDGVWAAGPEQNAALRRFQDFIGAPYMYRIQNAQGVVKYRTDLHSRAQIGTGDANPDGKPYSGKAADLNGVVSCSLVVDTEMVQADLAHHTLATPNIEVSQVHDADRVSANGSR